MRVHSIFTSINGEVCGAHQGRMCTFVRLAGCNLKCSWCDTEYARNMNSGNTMDVTDIVKEVQDKGRRYVTITGGEPLLQASDLYELCRCLKERKFKINIETNGSLIIPEWGWNIVDSWVADWKLPSSGMSSFMDLLNLQMLTEKDFIKFVVKDRNDFLIAMQVVKDVYRRARWNFPQFAFSPCFGTDVKELVKWMQTEGYDDLILSLQIHKLIGVE